MTNATMITNKLWLGNRFDADEWGGDFMICVLRDDEIIEPPSSCRRAISMPITEDRGGRTVVPRVNLDRVASKINELVNRGTVLVFCNSGMERSPLAVAWYLHRYGGYSFFHAYEFVKRARPIVQDREHWIRD